MSSLDPRTPVLVGAAQHSHRPGDGAVPAPHVFMADVAREAARDCDAANGPDDVLRRIEVAASIDLFAWPVPDPAALMAAELGIAPRATVRTARGGNGPAALLGDLSQRIADGELDVALIAFAEAFTPFRDAMRGGPATNWPQQADGVMPTWSVGVDHDASSAAETAAGLMAPVVYYPLFEHALRASAGRSRDEQRAHAAEIWARFAQVARENPHAWTRDPPADADALGTPSPSNRLVSDPYPKLLNANIAVDQGAALVLMSAGAAEAAGIPRERWVVVHATAGAADHWFASEREALDRSPAISACGRAALAHAGIAIDEIAHLDLYSCFPSAVQVAARELGVDLLDPSRPPTVTGGLTFAGGPANGYVLHALATLVGRLRADPFAFGASTAVGWYLTKHGIAVLGGPDTAPARGFAHHDVQAEIDAMPRRSVVHGEACDAVVETHTALFDHDGNATIAFATGLDADGRRAVGGSQAPDVVAALAAGDPLGATAHFDGAGGVMLV